jgi:hypothetical protein
MLFYFFVFTFIGFLLYQFFEKRAVIVIIVISILWGFSSAAVWGLASLGEMFLGFYLTQMIKKGKK